MAFSRTSVAAPRANHPAGSFHHCRRGLSTASGTAIASIIGQSRTAVNLQRCAATTAAHAIAHLRQEGPRQNLHQSQHETNMAAAVPMSVVTRDALARMLGLRQYIAQAAAALRRPYNSPAQR